jgi:hypothetical protein
MFIPQMFRGALILLIGISFAALQPVLAQSPAGTWVLYPAQSSVYTTAVQQPINADGTSNFKSNGKAVIPVKFSLSTAPGPVIFQSIYSDVDTTNDYSFLSFTPSSPLLFSQILTLSAVYTFGEGNCHGGSLRWSVRTSDTQSVFIYYGDYPNFTDCTTNNQSGANMIGQADLRYDTSQYVGGTFYDTYAHALTLVGSDQVLRASLVLDSGWYNAPLGDQVLTPSNVTVNGDTFVPLSGGGGQTCDLPPATIQISKTPVAATGDVNEPISIQPNDNNLQFRIVDCKYMYNLATSSLSGPGKYQVTVVINGTPAAGSASFDLK